MSSCSSSSRKRECRQMRVQIKSFKNKKRWNSKWAEQVNIAKETLHIYMLYINISDKPLERNQRRRYSYKLCIRLGLRSFPIGPSILLLSQRVYLPP